MEGLCTVFASPACGIGHDFTRHALTAHLRGYLKRVHHGRRAETGDKCRARRGFTKPSQNGYLRRGDTRHDGQARGANARFLPNLDLRRGDIGAGKAAFLRGRGKICDMGAHAEGRIGDRVAALGQLGVERLLFRAPVWPNLEQGGSPIHAKAGFDPVDMVGRHGA